MKGLIIVGAYCPDKEREVLLNNCIESLNKVKDDFDLMIVSHSVIPEYIASKVDYVFYDKKNDLITDWEYCNQPWFSPFDGLTILSTLIANHSTYLAAYRLFIGGLGIARNFKYKKVHWIEYDSHLTNFDDLYEDNKLLDDYTAIQYKKTSRNFENNLEWGFGCYQSINVEKLDDNLLIYDREKLLDILLKSTSKTNEKITQDLYELNGGKILFKDFENLLSKNNEFNLSNETKKEDLSGWYVPFYNTKEDSVFLVVWNNKYETPIDVNFIINNNQFFSFNNISKFDWSLKEVGKLENINSIITMVNGEKKNEIKFDDKLREIFKKTNYTIYT
jgi:hypothetical protein